MMERESFSALAERHMPLVYRVALNCVGRPADADDVTQNVMLRTLRSAPDFEGEEHTRRWLIRVTVNESRRLLTAPWRNRTVSLAELEGALPAQAPEERELLEQVLSLPAKYRLPLYLYYYEGYSVEEVGRLIGRKASTVQTQLARGREKLRTLLREEGYHG